MRHVLLLVILASGCTRESGAFVCTPGEQKGCDCVGGSRGVQICNPDGDALGECLGCPGGPQTDLSSVMDIGPQFDFPPGTDLTGVDLFIPPGSDLTSLPQDMSVAPPDLTMPDLTVPADLLKADLVGTTGTPCGIAMLVLDRSGSMTTTLPNTNVTRLDAARTGLNKLVANYGGRVPFGLSRFDAPSLTCDDGAEIAVEPMFGTATAIQTALAGTVAGASTNTGNMVRKIAADPAMHDPTRQGSFMILVTDGAPNCETGTNGDPKFTISEVDKAAKAAMPIKTFVIGIDVFSSDEAEMELMAIAGQVPCTSGFCGGKRYYPVKTQAEFDKALDLIANQIVGSAPGGTCGGFACFPAGAACTTGQSCCGTAGCKNLTNGDTENCGQCGTSCGTGATCSGGTCLCGGMTCPTGDKCCNGTCCSKTDMLPPQDMLQPPDLRNPDLGLPSCVCTHKACQFGCVAANCCYEDTIGAGSPCTATPLVCQCSGGGFPFGCF